MSKTDLLPILRDHFDTMRHAGTGRYAWQDFAVFYGLPLLVSAAVTIAGFRLTGVGNILTALSLMAGLLFNLLVLLYDTAVRVRDGSGEEASHRRELVCQLQANVTYALLVALAAAVLLGGLSMAGQEKAGLPWSAVSVLLLVHFILVLMMVLKRFRAAFLGEFPAGGRGIPRGR